MTQAYIVEALRTAGGKRGGALRDWHPADMGAEVLNALVERSGIDPAAIEDVIVGCVSQIGEQSFHVGRNLVLASNLPDSVPAVTIDRQCGSSQQALHFAAQAVMSGTQDVVIAAGVESMTRVPMGTPVSLPMQAGIGIGPWSQRIKDRYGVTEFSQFTGAEMIVSKYGFSREELDAFAVDSHRKAAAATSTGAFDREIIPLRIVDSVGQETLHDETPEAAFEIYIISRPRSEVFHHAEKANQCAHPNDRTRNAEQPHCRVGRGVAITEKQQTDRYH